MVNLGYKLSSEEFNACDLVRWALRAERAGFDFALISDHFHPWTDRQGQSPFVWSVLGAIAQATTRIRVGTAVTCPTIRVHPAIIAQAAATTASLMEGRFFLGVGTGENLNEHVIGQGWPPPEVRLQMLEEAIHVLRLLWAGEATSFHGNYYVVDNARLYTLPKEPPDLMVAASRPHAADLAGRVGDAMINTETEGKLVKEFARAGGADKPRFVEMTVCWAPDEGKARKTAHEVWGLAALKGMLFTELPTPKLFECALAPVKQEDIGAAIVCGPDPRAYVEKINHAEKAGYTHVCLHQVGPEQEAFMAFCERELLPEFPGRRPAARPAHRSATPLLRAAGVNTKSTKRTIARRNPPRGM